MKQEKFVLVDATSDPERQRDNKTRVQLSRKSSRLSFSGVIETLDEFRD